jgi:hypothetical protein
MSRLNSLIHVALIHQLRRPSRLFCFVSLALWALLFSFAASAQWRLPGGVVIQKPQLPQKPNARQQGRETVDVDRVCPKLVAWQRHLMDEYPGTDFQHTIVDKLQPMAIPLFAEPLFSEYFGTPYAQLDASARQKMLMEKVRPCMLSPQYRPELGFANVVLQPAWYPNGVQIISPTRLIPELEALQQARAAIAQSQSAMSALPATAEGYDKVKEIERTTAPSLALVWPSERKAFASQAQAQISRLAVPALAAKAQALLAQATGYDGAVALRHAPENWKDLWSAVGPEQRAAYQAQLDAKFQAVLKPLLAEQHARMVAVTTGPQTLPQGTAWYQQFTSRFVADLGGGAETDALAQEFRKRRNAQLVAALPELRRRVQTAKSAGAVGEVLSQCCSLADDAQSPGLSQVQSLAAQRSTTLTEQAAGEERARAKARALGASYKQGDRSVEPAAAGSGESRAQEKEQPSTDGGPTQSEIYDALQAKLDNYNESRREIRNKCKNLHQNNEQDPILGMQCLQEFMIGAVSTGDESASIEGLKRLECAKAVGQPGYICDYVMSLSMNLTLPESLKSILSSGQVTQARFVRMAKGWMIMPN